MDNIKINVRDLIEHFGIVLSILIAAWGGLVRYLMELQDRKAASFQVFKAITRMIISGFAGAIAGLCALAMKFDPVYGLAIAGVIGCEAGSFLSFLSKKVAAKLADKMEEKIK